MMQSGSHRRSIHRPSVAPDRQTTTAAIQNMNASTLWQRPQWEVMAAAARDLFLTKPTTRAGALALLRYIIERESAGDELLLLDSLPGKHRRACVAICANVIDALEQTQ